MSFPCVTSECPLLFSSSLAVTLLFCIFLKNVYLYIPIHILKQFLAESYSLLFNFNKRYWMLASIWGWILFWLWWFLSFFPFLYQQPL